MEDIIITSSIHDGIDINYILRHYFFQSLGEIEKDGMIHIDRVSDAFDNAVCRYIKGKDDTNATAH